MLALQCMEVQQRLCSDFPLCFLRTNSLPMHLEPLSKQIMIMVLTSLMQTAATFFRFLKFMTFSWMEREKKKGSLNIVALVLINQDP